MLNLEVEQEYNVVIHAGVDRIPVHTWLRKKPVSVSDLRKIGSRSDKTPCSGSELITKQYIDIIHFFLKAVNIFIDFKDILEKKLRFSFGLKTGSGSGYALCQNRIHIVYLSHYRHT